jgi:hypothetical protein
VKLREFHEFNEKAYAKALQHMRQLRKLLTCFDAVVRTIEESRVIMTQTDRVLGQVNRTGTPCPEAPKARASRSETGDRRSPRKGVRFVDERRIVHPQEGAMSDDQSNPHHLFENPAHWRHRAEEMRVLAEDMREPSAKETMLRLAEDYERLARRAEERANSADDAANATPPSGATTMAAAAANETVTVSERNALNALIGDK